MRTVFLIAFAWVGLWLGIAAAIWTENAKSMPPALHADAMTYWQSMDDVMYSDALEIRSNNCHQIRDYLDGYLMEIGCKHMTWKN